MTSINEQSRTEDEIRESWTDTDLLVSIVCCTYNHEPYIAQAIRGFLMQETSFAFEIVIHDDASTDDTASIIRSYEALYPNLLRPIYSSTNLYSTTRNAPLLKCVNMAVGFYVAICEGDDYWCDSNKLEIQVRAMKQDETAVMSFHPAHVLRGDELQMVTSHEKYDVKHIGAKYVISAGGAGCPTPSLMFKHTFFDNLPDWFVRAPIGDYYAQCLAASIADVMFISKPMAVYRFQAKGSSTSNLRRLSPEQRLAHTKHLVIFDRHLAEEVGENFRDDIDRISLLRILGFAIFFLKRMRLIRVAECLYDASNISVKLLPAALFESISCRIKKYFKPNEQSPLQSPLQ